MRDVGTFCDVRTSHGDRSTDTILRVEGKFGSAVGRILSFVVTLKFIVKLELEQCMIQFTLKFIVKLELEQCMIQFIILYDEYCRALLNAKKGNCC
jgi:hypothetical protein